MAMGPDPEKRIARGHSMRGNALKYTDRSPVFPSLGLERVHFPIRRTDGKLPPFPSGPDLLDFPT